MTKNLYAVLLSGLLCAMVGFAAPARAAIAPNPGGPTVATNSTTAVISYDNVPVTQRVDNYATTLLTFLNGGQIGTQSFALAFSDPTVQSAVSSADSILTGDGASFGPPIQDSLITALLSSVTATAPTYSCSDFESSYPPGTTLAGTNTTTTETFGPATINVGACLADTFTVLSGQLDINVNTENDYLVTQDVLTTDTYLTTAIYEIDGLTQQGPGGPVSVPEAGTIGMLAAGLGGLAMLRRRRRPSMK